MPHWLGSKYTRVINTTNQTPVRIFKNNNGIGQRWDWNNTTGEVKGLDNKCLDAGSNSLGQFIRINDCTGGNNQKWDFTENYGVQNRTSKLCTGLAQAYSNGGSFTVDTVNGNNLYLVGCNRDNCTWSFQNSGVSGYNATAVGGDSCAVVPYVGADGNPNPTVPPTTNSNNTNTSNQIPTSNTNPSNTNNIGNGTDTPDNEVAQDDNSKYDEFLNGQTSLNVTENQTSLNYDIWAPYANGASEAWDMSKDLFTVCTFLDFGCDSRFWSAFGNIVTFIARFIFGLLKGAFSAVV